MSFSSYLSDITGNPIYKEKVEKIRHSVKNLDRPSKLYPVGIHPDTGKWGIQYVSVGARGDSFYEYLFKEWLRSGKQDLTSKELYVEALKDIEEEMVQTSAGGLIYIAEIRRGILYHTMDHLACYSGGMFGLAAQEEKDQDFIRWMKIAEGITNTCQESYDRSDTKLGPEVFMFSDKVEAVANGNNKYILRPEVVESYFVMWRLTKDQKYRDWGWEVVQDSQVYLMSKLSHFLSFTTVIRLVCGILIILLFDRETDFMFSHLLQFLLHW